jgi:hypothetical protein
MQVIGICRFSYPGIGGFQIEHRSIEDRIAYLYAPDRMEERFRTLETITLPPLRAQTDPDFTLLIVVGTSLPDPYLERLVALTEDMPQVLIQPRSPGKHRKVMQDAINSVRLPGADPCLQFRMDDDDAVACSFVGRLREVAQDIRGFARKHRHVAIDFNQGYIMRPGAKGLAAAPPTLPYTTPGLAMMFKPKVPLSIMNFAHGKVAQMMPTVTITGEDMMIRGHNDYNDSRQKPGVRPVELSLMDATQEAHIKATYNIDADHVRRVYSAV